MRSKRGKPDDSGPWVAVMRCKYCKESLSEWSGHSQKDAKAKVEVTLEIHYLAVHGTTPK